MVEKDGNVDVMNACNIQIHLMPRAFIDQKVELSEK